MEDHREKKILRNFKPESGKWEFPKRIYGGILILVDSVLLLIVGLDLVLKDLGGWVIPICCS